MNKYGVYFFVLCVGLGMLFVEAGDKVGYNNREFTKTREVGETVSFCSFTASTTPKVIKFHKPAHTITITNNDSTNSVYVDYNGRSVFNYSKTDGQTFAGSSEFRSASAAFITDNVAVGDIITITTGDDVGCYSIIKIVSTNTVYLSKDLTDDASSIEYTLYSGVKIDAGETKTLDVGSDELSIMTNADTAVTEVIVTFQKN